MSKRIVSETYDVLVVGGGMAGCGAALAAARHGAKVCLIHNRPMPGGNAGSESRLHALGADCHVQKPDCREGGIIEEILLENKKRNPEHSFALFDVLLWEKLRFQPGLTLRLNTHMTEATVSDKAITSVVAEDMLNEQRLVLSAAVYVDCTGDGSLAHYAGAPCMHGREARQAYGEPDAPEAANAHTMGNTLQLIATDRGHPVPFQTPPWIRRFEEAELAKRGHALMPGAHALHGYWWNELGGGQYDTIEGANEIRDELLRSLMGIWDHLKNSGHHPQANSFELDWIQTWPSKRESRRIQGPYVLTENDVLENRIFEDAVAYGGWRIDMHAPDSLYNTDSHLSVDRHFPGVYTIPYRCLYSADVQNLMMAGRPISATSLAHSSARVIATACLTGQAAGTAAALALEKGTSVAGIAAHIRCLQQRLLEDGCFLPGTANEDPLDLARSAQAECSSEQPGHGAANLTDGIARNWQGPHGWVSQPWDKKPWVRLFLASPAPVSRIQLSLDSDYNREIHTTLSEGARAKQYRSAPDTLVRDGMVRFFRGPDCVGSQPFRENYQALLRIPLDAPVLCDAVEIRVEATHGDPCARMFEVRIH